MKYFFLALLFFCVLFLQGQSILGKWKTFDEETGKEKSIVEISDSGGLIYGKILKLFNPSTPNPKCTKCPEQDKDKPIEGLVIIKGLKKSDGKYKDGKILDPKNGKLYNCVLKLNEDGKLDVRGYIFIPLIGRSQTWERIK